MAAALMIAAAFVAQVGNYAVYWLGARSLPPGGLAVFAALMSVSMLVVLPVSGIQTTLARDAAQVMARRGINPARRVVRETLLSSGGLAVVTLGVALAALPAVTWVTGMSGVQWLLAGIWLASLVVLQVFTGAAQGLRHYVTVAAIVALPLGLLRPLVAFFGMQSAGLLTGLIGALCCASAVGLVWLAVWSLIHRPRPEPANRADSPAWTEHDADTVFTCRPAVFGLVCLAVIAHADVVVATWRLTEQRADVYALAAVCGKLAFAIPSAVTLVGLPEAARRLALGQGVTRPLFMMLMWTAAVGSAITALWLVMPPRWLGVLVGGQYQYAVRLAAISAFAATCVGVLHIHLIMAIARRTVTVWRWWVPLAAVVTLSLLAFGSTTARMAVIVAGWTFVAALVLELGPHGLLRTAVREWRARYQVRRRAHTAGSQ